MQRYAAMILALLLALTTAGCMAPAAQETQEHAGNGVALETLEATAGNGWGITLSAKDVTPTGLTLVIAQSGGAPSGTLQFGSSFQLSVLVDGVWSDVPYTVDADSVAWTAEAYIVAMEIPQNIVSHGKPSMGSCPQGFTVSARNSRISVRLAIMIRKAAGPNLKLYDAALLYSVLKCSGIGS